MKYLFGPVNSRRLGISLGVDLMPCKTCSLDCVYCECGPTTVETSETGEYVPTDEVIAELDRFLCDSPRLDVITFSGSGEPTLHSGIGRIIGHIKRSYPRYRVAVLTNGTTLGDPAVRGAIAGADIVVPSLDAVSPGAFNAIVRPSAGITPDAVVAGLEAFRGEFQGKIFLEIFIVPGINDTGTELALLKNACLKIRPDLIQINSLDRPGTESWVLPAERDRLESIARFFEPLAVEIIGSPADRRFAGRGESDLAKSIIGLLRRRPSTADDIEKSLGAGRGEVEKALSKMVEIGMITVERLDRGEFYRVV